MADNYNMYPCCTSETLVAAGCAEDIRADIVVNNSTFRIWGRVTNRCGRSIQGSEVMLLRRTGAAGSCFELVAETLSDADGMYSFDVEDSTGCEYYKVTARA